MTLRQLSLKYWIRQKKMLEFEQRTKNFKIMIEMGLLDLPDKHKAINTKFIFKVKRKSDGTLERFKARLVFQNYKWALQPYGEGVYSPVVNKTTVKIGRAHV